MGWIEIWLDSQPAPNFSVCQAAAQQAGAQGFNAYLGGRYLFGAPWPPSLVATLSAAGFGVFGTWVSLRPGEGGYATGYQDGLDAVAAAASYPEIALINYDIEPVTWNANRPLVPAAMSGFADAVRTSGRPKMIYGLQATLLAASGYDRYWATFDLGSDDPTASAGTPGERAVQFAQRSLAGVNWDVSHSEFSLLAGRGGQDSPSYYREDGYVDFDATWNGNQNLFRIEPNGTLVHSWTTGTGVWQSEALGIGYVPGAMRLSKTGDGSQLHVFALKPDGGAAHFWQNRSQTNWNVEQIAA